MSSPTTTAPAERLEELFRELADRWRAETLYLSSSTDIAMHPAYQRIIGLGPAVIPLILAELARQPDRWFWALHALTGVDPVLPSDRGKLPAMTQAWLRWGRENGHLP
jgi:hypothetical protein